MNFLTWPERLLFRPEKQTEESPLDDVDRAQDVTERFHKDCLAEHRRRTLPHRTDASRRDCADCGCPIPPARLAALPDALCCVDCQQLREAYGVDHHR